MTTRNKFTINHDRIRLIAFCAAAALVVSLLAANAFGLTPPRGVGFRVLLTLLIIANVVWWTYADGVLVRWLRAWSGSTATRACVALVLAGVQIPLFEILLNGHAPSLTGMPVWAIGTVQFWHMALAVMLPVAIPIGALVQALVRRTRAGTEIQPIAKSDTRMPQISRREMLTAAAVYSPVVLAGATAGVGACQAGRFEVNTYDVPAPWLPARLRGLTITQISDIHLGRLYRPDMLPRLIDAANALKGDIVVVTGDIVDFSNDMLPPAIDALRQLTHKHGLYACVGNHDLIDDGFEFCEAIRSAGIDLLVNECRPLHIGGDAISVAGIDWSGNDSRVGPRGGHAELVSATMRGHDASQEGPCIMLAHHPHAFDAIDGVNVPLMLSGHTHGGQLMLFPPRADGRGEPSREFGVGRLARFRYMRGFYARGDRTLFVNRGVGNWFPIRINSPAEIVRLRLV